MADPAISASAPSPVSDDHDRWLHEMTQEYARRMLVAEHENTFMDQLSQLRIRSSSTDESFNETGDAPVYRSMAVGEAIGGSVAGRDTEALRPVYRGRSATHPRAAVDVEWKRSCPPLLHRQLAFTR